MSTGLGTNYFSRVIDERVIDEEALSIDRSSLRWYLEVATDRDSKFIVGYRFISDEDLEAKDNEW